jgi:hypothetical protein
MRPGKQGGSGVRADAADRIFAAPPPEPLQPRVSIPRIFALGLVMPFAHLHRLILAGIMPIILIAGFFLTPVGREAIDFLNFVVETSNRTAFYPAGTPGTEPVMTVPSAAGAGWACLASFVAMALWLCTWQRGALRGFTEPVGPWLLGSLRRLPGYAVALVIWQIAPFIVTLPATFLIGASLRQNMLMAEYGVPNGLGVTAEMLTPLQLWVAGIGMLTFALLGLWISARLLPLPAVVAGQGWRKAVGRAWRASSGHGFGLSASMIGYTLISLLLILLVATIFTYTLPVSGATAGDTADLVLVLKWVFAVTSAGAYLILFWYTAIAALLLRESGSLDDPLDLATFD